MCTNKKNINSSVLIESSTSTSGIDFSISQVLEEIKNHRCSSSSQQDPASKNKFVHTTDSCTRNGFPDPSKMSSATNRFSPKKTKKMKYISSDNICHEINTYVPGETMESTFCDSKIGETKQHINSEVNSFAYAGDCVEFLDSLPFDNEEVDEDDIDYYDNVIET